MKKLLICLIVSAAMILSIMPTVYGNSIPDINGSYEKAVDFVVAIGIMDVSEDGNFDGDKSVTRAEFCRMAYKLFNMNVTMTENHFKDVYEDTPQINEINALVELGILNGVGDNKFAPDKEISFTECIKIILDMMGYKDYCTVRGGYPGGYIKTAQQIDLTKNLGNGASKKHIAQMMYNAALCEIPEIKSISTDGNLNLATQGTTLLEEYHDIYRVKGIVTANHLFSIDGDKTTDPGKIRMNGMIMELENDRYRLYDSVGYYTDIFYRYDKDSDIKTIVYGVKDLQRSNEEIIETEDIVNYNSYTIYCEGGDKYSFDSKAIVLKNNELLQSYGTEDFTTAYGKVVCTSYGDYTVVRIIDWDIYVVNFISSDERKIYNKYNSEKYFELPENDVDKKYSLHNAYGRSEKFESVKPGDVLCVAEGNGFTDITRITEKQTHTVTAIGDDKYYYDGGYFELGDNLKAAVNNKKETVPKIGQSVQVVYDLYGRAAGFFNKNNEGEMLVFLINTAPKSGISKVYEFLFMTDAGEFIVLEANDKLTYIVGNAEDKISGQELYSKLLEDDVIKRQVAYVKTNSENKLTYFEGASSEEKWVDGRLCQKSVSGNYKKEPMSIEGKASGNAETVVFAYPVSESDRTNTDEYSVYSLSTLSNNDSFSATVYQREMEKIPVIAMSVLQNNVSTTPASLFVVDKIRTVIDDEDGEIIEITGFENGVASSIRLSDESVMLNPSLISGNSDTFTLSCGDVIRYTRGVNNYITGITVKYDYETSGDTPWAGGIYNTYTNLFHLVAGKAELVDGNYVKINKGVTEGEENGFEIQRAGNIKITVVDPNSDDVRLRAGTMDDVIDARSGNPSFVIARTSSGTCNEIIIYR